MEKMEYTLYVERLEIIHPAFVSKRTLSCQKKDPTRTSCVSKKTSTTVISGRHIRSSKRVNLNGPDQRDCFVIFLQRTCTKGRSKLIIYTEIRVFSSPLPTPPLLHISRQLSNARRTTGQSGTEGLSELEVIYGSGDRGETNSFFSYTNH